MLPIIDNCAWLGFKLQINLCLFGYKYGWRSSEILWEFSFHKATYIRTSKHALILLKLQTYTVISDIIYA